MKPAYVKNFSFLLLVSILLCQLTVILYAENDTDFPDTSKARATCVYNLNTDKNIYSTNLDQRLFPAGAVKMMTGLIACEMLEGRLSESVTITEEMLSKVSGANIKLKAGMSVTVENLLYVVLCGGGNDAAAAIATLCASDIDAFVSIMNSKAKEWGMSNTKFTNPIGLDDKNMYSTLADIMVLAKKASQNPTYLKASSAMSYIYTPIGTTDEIKFFNRNALISTYYALEYRNPNAQGLISGSTDLGGYCVITFFQRKSTSYICAVMGASSDDESIYSYKIANELIDYTLEKFDYLKIAESGRQVGKIPVELAMPQGEDEQVAIPCAIKDDVYSLTYRGIKETDIQYRCYFHKDKLTAPVTVGEVVGGVDIIYNGEVIGQAKLITSKGIQESKMLLFLDTLKNFFSGRMFIFSVLFFILIFGIYYYFDIFKHKRHNVKKINYFK